MKILKAVGFYLLPICFFLWSFILTDHSLYYSTLAPFLSFQRFLWQFAKNHLLVTVIYLLLVASFSLFYLLVLKESQSFKDTLKKRWLLPIVLFLLIMAISNNALSYDLYNYMFDAKLVLFHHLDPHKVAAIELFNQDDWVRFMRNIVFPTTYGYGWTAISLVPYFLGGGKFITVFLLFKLYSLLGLSLLFVVQRKILRMLGSGKNLFFKLSLFFALPLSLIEILSSAHNDVWMMLLAFLSLFVLLPGSIAGVGRSDYKIKSWPVITSRIFLSFFLIIWSTQVKRATLLLIPVWLFFLCGLLVVKLKLPQKLIKSYLWMLRWWGDGAAILMFLPLFSALSRMFHPWYLIWSLSFLPFVRSKLLRTMLVTFSFTSLLRYVPVLYTGMYSTQIEAIQRLITWSAVPIGLIIYLAARFWSRRNNE